MWDRVIGDARWGPNQETWVALAPYLLVVGGLSLAFQVFTTARVAANFITFGPITLALLGVGVPVFYMTLLRRRSLTDLGITWRQLIPSLILGLLLGWDTYRETLATLDWQPTRATTPLIVMAVTVGIFEAIFFRGWLQLRFEEAFGLVPGLVLASLCYSLYHVGYGMTGREMLFLFGLGMTFAAVFRLTKSVFVLWPFYTSVGSIYTNVTEGLTMPFEATYGFLLTLGLIAALVCLQGPPVAGRHQKGRLQHDSLRLDRSGWRTRFPHRSPLCWVAANGAQPAPGALCTWAIDGLFLSVMPVLATWQAFAVLDWSGTWYGQVLAAAYHLGYPEFRNARVLLPVAGNGIMSLVYLLTTSPLAPVGAHAAMHVAAVLHGAESTVQLPPHSTREAHSDRRPMLA